MSLETHYGQGEDDVNNEVTYNCVDLLYSTKEFTKNGHCLSFLKHPTLSDINFK